MNDLKFTTAGEYMSSPKVYEENIDYELTQQKKIAMDGMFVS